MSRALFRAAVSIWLAAAAPIGASEARADRAAKPPAPRPWMEKTIVVATNAVGPYVLDGIVEFEFGALKGAQVEYSQDDRPEIKIVLQMYSTGPGTPETALENGVEHFRIDLELMETLFDYRDLEIGAAVDVAPSSPAVDDDPSPANASTGTAAMAANGRNTDPPRELRGKRLPFRYRMPIGSLGEHVPIHSAGYVFHDRFNYIRGRVSARPEALDEASLSALADDAMRLLVPSLRIVNVGACADGDASGESAIEDTCVSDLDETALLAAHPEATAVVVAFDPSHWGGE